MFLILSRDEKYMFKILKTLALFFLAFLNVAVFAINVNFSDPTTTPDGSPDLASSGVRAQITTDSSGRYVYAVWDDLGVSGTVQVAISSDFGVTWADPTSTPAGSPNLASSGVRAQITTDSSGRYVYAVWDDLGVSGTVQVAISSDFGVTWVSPTTTPDGSPDLASSGESAQITTDSSGRYVYAVWDEAPGAVQVAISSDFGVTWVSPTSTPTGVIPDLALSGQFAQITTDSSGRYVYAVWEVSGPAAVQVAISSDFGVTWVSPTSTPDIPPNLASSGELAQITTDSSGRYVYAVWGTPAVQVANGFKTFFPIKSLTIKRG